MAEKLTPKPARAFEGVADPAYLVSEIEQLRDIAREAGVGTLEYLLECAAIEARALIAAKDRGDYDAPAGRHDGPSSTIPPTERAYSRLAVDVAQLLDLGKEVGGICGALGRARWLRVSFSAIGADLTGGC